MTAGFPRFRAVAGHAVLAEFAETVSDAANRQVVHLDAALAGAGFAGFVQAVPAYVSLLVQFDPQVTDHRTVEQHLRALQGADVQAARTPTRHEVAVCYEAEFAPDLAEVAALTGLSAEAVIAAHLQSVCRVVMYGFAPGYAYLSGVAPALHLPRKLAAVRGVAAGSVIIAGAQCLVTTLTMPTGWWRIGRSPVAVLRDDSTWPFLFDVGDEVCFRRIGRAALDPGREG